MSGRDIVDRIRKYALFLKKRYDMQVMINPKERILNLANEMSETQLLEIANFMQFIRLKNNEDTLDFMKASESTLDFWDNEEDKVWDNV